MGLFFKKKNQAEPEWTVRLGDVEHKVRNADVFESNIDDALTDVEMGNVEFLILSPSKPVNGFTFLQTCPDEEEGYLHIEAGMDKMNADGRIKIVCHDHFTTGEVLDLFITFFRNQTIDVGGWYELV